MCLKTFNITLSIAAIFISNTLYAFSIDNEISKGNKGLIFYGKPGVQISTKKINAKTEETKIVNGVEYTKVYDYWLPPEPDQEFNNSTLAGVDVNNNKVRDDIERKIIFSQSLSLASKGARLQEARAYFLYMENPEQKLNVRNLIDKSFYLQMHYSGNNYDRKLEEQFKKDMFNTDERKLIYAKVQGQLSGTVTNVIYQPHRFVERYADYTVSERGTLKDYKLKEDAFEDKPYPYYSEVGNIQGYLNNGISTDLTNEEFCNTNYGTPNISDCKIKINKEIELEKKYGIEGLIKQGIIHE